MNDRDRMVSSYDDLVVVVQAGERVALECPSCGFTAKVRRRR